jgi:transcriptional regulatory protein LEU3
MLVSLTTVLFLLPNVRLCRFCHAKSFDDGFFAHLVDDKEATCLLDDAVIELWRMSAGNNDLPAGLRDIIAFFCALPDPFIIGGRSIDDLRLTRVKN